ncbi:serine/threonine-protein kinase [Paludisphaera soli]|uniref:serine/threonine-protein kinase n=1 Tax=Paludisphaera soli TaxID=2712865 RepID=UPI0013EC4F12|nr:serine/threonine-protein kinase [Paludisphaera soli]
MIGPGSTLNDRFLLNTELGRGGMGAVYAATDLVLQRDVAIKVLKDQQAGEEVSKRLRLEAQIAARLLHDNVVRIYDFGQAGGTSFLVMEKVDGTSYGRRWRGISLGERLKILAGVAEALDYAHHQGVIHRDVKPGNVLLTSADVPKLSDFGLSLLAEHDEAAGIVRGTPHYMSPEQAKGQKLTYRTDLYSLGVMLYESVSGAVPFAGPPVTVMAQHANTAPPPLNARAAGASPELEKLIFALLAKKPEDRPPGGSAVAKVLRAEAGKLLGEAEAGVGEAPPPEEEPVEPMMDLGALAELGEGRAVTHGSATAGGRPARRPSTAPARITAAEAADLAASPLVRKMLRTILAEPISLNPDERYLSGYYLAYLLVGSRRRPFYARRPLERLNADRARLILALTYALTAHDSEAAVQEAAQLLDQRIEVRPALNPVVLAKFLSWRDSPNRRRMLRQVRKALQDASAYAREHMTDPKGVLNVGLIPRSLEDLRKIAPEREVGDELVERWNRLAEAWREHADLRETVLRYAGGAAYRDPSGAALWAEVVYPLVEMARWQRARRGRLSDAWHFLASRVLHLPDPGEKLHRTLTRHLAPRVVEQLDRSAVQLDRVLARVEPDEDEPADDQDARAARLGQGSEASRIEAIAAEADAEVDDSDQVLLVDVDPIRFLQGELHELWKEAAGAMQKAAAGPGARPVGHRHTPLGPYRLTVVPSMRGASAGQVVVQGMPSKQLELLTPSLRTAGSRSRPIVAAWPYADNSLLLAYQDFKSVQRYILWDAPRGRQSSYTDPAEVYRELAALGMEVPSAMEGALSKSFRPQGGRR